MSSARIHDLPSKILDKSEAAIEVLREVEWTNWMMPVGGPMAVCPSCRGLKTGGHRDDCRLAAVIEPKDPPVA